VPPAYQRQCGTPHDTLGGDDVPTVDRLGRDCASAHAVLLRRGYVQFHPVLADLAGGFKPALMLGHALYWTRHWLQRHPEREGWFWKTAVEWREATALTPREQESAREGLRATGVWHERRVGAPARLHFRVDLVALAERLAALPERERSATSRWDRLTSLLGLPIIYFRPLADLAGGPAAGLVLSHLMSLQRVALQRGTVQHGGYFAISVEESRIALAISIKVQRNARDALKRAGFVQEAWTSARPSRLVARVNLAAILACLTGQEHKPLVKRGHRAGAAEAPQEDRARVVAHEGNVTRIVRLLVGSPGIPPGDGSPTRVAQSSNLKHCHRGESCRNVETRVALLSDLYSKRDSSNTPTTPARDCARLVDALGRRSSRIVEAEPPPPAAGTGEADEPSGHVELIFPPRLEAALHDGARRIVMRAPPDLRQPLLDELAGHMASKHKVIENPLGWLHALAGKAAEGNLVLTVASTIAAARAAQARYEAALANAGAGPAFANDRTPPNATAPEAVAQARARLKELRNELRAGPPARLPLESTSDATCRDLALSRTRTTLNGCALSQEGTTDQRPKGSRHATHES
jgi:hypothetical protein